MKIKLGTHDLTDQLYKKNWPGWKDLQTIHLMINHRFYLDETSRIKEFDEDNIQDYKFTYGAMCLTVMKKFESIFPNII